jgi:hypothetical protein
VANFFKKVGDAVAKTVSWIPHTTAAEKRSAMAATSAQISYYQESKAQLLASAAADTEQKGIERKRINEKQIRAKRAAYRSRGAVTPPQDTSTPSGTLG